MIRSSAYKKKWFHPAGEAVSALLAILFLVLLPGPGLGSDPGVTPEKAAKGILQVSGDEVMRSQRIDMVKGKVYETSSADSIFLGPPQIDSLDSHVHKLRKEGVRKSLRESNLTNLTKGKGGLSGETGLIPDIPLPLGSELKVGGSEKITFGGRRDYSPEQQRVETYRQSAFPDLQMKQELQVNLEGVVAKKVHVFVDQNSKRESDLKNTIRINYQGDEDEVMKSIEAGNTDISIPGSQFVNFTGSHKGLFGIKAQAELAGLQLTGIASKEEGQSEKASFVGKSKIDTVNIEDWRFAQRQFFHLGLNPGDSLIPTSLNVYISTQPNFADFPRQQAKGAPRGIAFLDPPYPDSNPPYPGDWLKSWFAIQEPGLDKDYSLVSTSGAIIGLNSPVQEGTALGVCYVAAKMQNGVVVGYDTVGSAVPPKISPWGDSLVALKLLKPKVSDSLSWTERRPYPYMLRNMYDLGSRDIGDSVHVKILRKVGGTLEEQRPSDGKSYALALGLADANGWNLIGRGTFLPQFGVLFVPIWNNQKAGYRPFDSDSVDPENRGADFRNSQIYDLNLSNLNSSYTKYTIEAVYRRKRTSYNLGKTDILSGSENVSIGIPPNTRKLTKGTDYDIDYDTGEITFRSHIQSELERPGTELSVDFDYAPFLALASKSILGMRGVYKFGEESQLGATYISRSERTPELRPRLGEEPYRNSMAEMDLTLKAHPEWMTKTMDKLPLIETEERSNFSLSGEVAQSYPNPNTKGAVFIDDMEGSKISTSLGILRTDWSLSSLPVGRDTGSFDQIYWNNPQAGVKAKEINPNLTGLEGDEIRTVLRLHTTPGHGGDSSWGGVMRVLSTTGEDFTQAKLLSVWIKAPPKDTLSNWRPKLYVDLGTSMAEDVPWRRVEGEVYIDSTRRRGYGYLDSEDPEHTGFNLDKDVGLDGVKKNDGEHNIQYDQDSGNDDYPEGSPSPDDWPRLNGTEGNLKFDSEDLNGDLELARSNDYFQYEFDLTQPDNSPLPKEPGNWQHFVVALNDSLRYKRRGAPDWRRTIYARMWLTGFPRDDSVSIAEVEVVGNKWLNDGITRIDTLRPPVGTSEKFNIDVINNQEDSAYTSPFDPGRDERNRPRREQSLVLKFDSLGPGHAASGHQALFEAENYTGYRKMSFYIHGTLNSTPTFFFRMGMEGSQNETTNYYEYRIPIPAGTGWQTIDVDLERMTHLKTLIPPDSAYTYRGKLSDGPYQMKVNGLGPSLTGIRRLSVGIENDPLINRTPISGEIWVDELMLESARKDRGTAARANLELQFADILGLRGDYTYRDSHFHGLTEREGQGFTSSNLGLTASLSGGKFLPKVWGINLPVSFTSVETKSLPRFSTGSDVILTRQESGAKRSLTIDRRADVSFNKGGRGGRWWTRWTVDRWTAQGSWGRRMSDGETAADTSRTISGSFSYNLTPEKKTWTLFRKLRVNYLPSALSMATNYSKLEQRSYNKYSGRIYPNTPLFQRNYTGTATLGYQPIDPLEYSLTVNRDLTQTQEGGLWERRLGIGIESGRTQRVGGRYSLSQLRWLQPNFSYAANYTEDHSVALRNTTPDSFDIRNVSLTTSSTVGASLSLSSIVRILTRIRNIGVPKDSIEARDKRILKQGGGWWALVQLEKLADRFQILQGTFSQDRNSTASGLERRPSWEYMVGLREGVAGVPRHRTNFLDQFGRTNSFSLSSGATFTTLDLRFRYDWRNTKTIAAQTTNFTTTRTWPDLDITLSALDRLPTVKRVASSASLNSSYSISKEEGGDNVLGVSSTKRTREFSPVASLQMVWKKGMTTTLTVNDRRTVTQSFLSNHPKNVSQSRDIAMQFAYSLSGTKGIQLFPGKRWKFKSNLDLSTSMTYAVTLDSTYDNNPTNPIAYENTNTTSLSFKPAATYSFTASVSGGMDAEYTQEKNRKAQLSRKVIGLNFWAQFKF